MVLWTPNPNIPPKETKVGWRVVTRKEYFFPNGEPRAFDVVGRINDRDVAVLGLTPEYNVVVAEQYRPGPDQSMDELPGGRIESAESPEEAARREFREETGYEAGTIQLLGTAHHDGYSTAKHYYFIAYDCVKKGEPQPEPNEWVEVKEMSIPDFIASAKQGNVTDTAAVLMALDTLTKLTR